MAAIGKILRYKDVHAPIIINFNHCTDGMLNYIARELKNSKCSYKKLTLMLRRQKLSEEIESIASIITSNASAQELVIDLSNDEIKDKDVLILAKAVASGRCHPKLTLRLSNINNHYENSITDDGANALLHMIESSARPLGLSLDLANNEVTPELLIKINQALDKNKNEKPRMYECVLVQQGLLQNKSILSKLPQAIANEICSYLVSIEGRQNNNLFNEKLKMAAVPKMWTPTTSFFITKKQIQAVKAEDNGYSCCSIM